MKVMLIVSQSSTVIGFRKKLIEKIQSKGHDVVVVCGDCVYKDEIEKMNCSFYYAELNNRKINLLKSFRYVRLIKKIAMKEKPDVSMTFMLKPNTFGVIGLKKAGIKNVISMVEGLGDTFNKSGLKWLLIKKVVIHLYKKSFKHVRTVIFLNNDDLSLFEKLKIVNDNKSILVNGIGVDLEKYSFKPVNINSNKFVMVARMIKSKGVIDYCECARIVRETHPEAEFFYLGAEGDVKISDIKPYINNKDIIYCGNVKNVIPFLEDSIFFVLPSKYGEGKPMSIMEAEAIGRGIITTNNVGCRDLVIDGYNGFVIEKNDISTMVKCCLKVIEDKTIALCFGKNSRLFAEKELDAEKINAIILSIIEEKHLQ